MANNTVVSGFGILLSVALVYLVGCRAYSIYCCGRKKEHSVEPLAAFHLLPPTPPTSWWGCQALPSIGAVSMLELAANSRSTRMSQASTHHVVGQ